MLFYPQQQLIKTIECASFPWSVWRRQWLSVLCSSRKCICGTHAESLPFFFGSFYDQRKCLYTITRSMRTWTFKLCANLFLYRYGAGQLAVSKHLPTIGRLLVDPNEQVREQTVATLEEIYRNVGDRLRPELAKLDGVLVLLLQNLSFSFSFIFEWWFTYIYISIWISLFCSSPHLLLHPRACFAFVYTSPYFLSYYTNFDFLPSYLGIPAARLQGLFERFDAVASSGLVSIWFSLWFSLSLTEDILCHVCFLSVAPHTYNWAIWYLRGFCAWVL